MPAIETAAMPKVAGMAPLLRPCLHNKTDKDFHIKNIPVKRGLNIVPEYGIAPGRVIAAIPFVLPFVMEEVLRLSGFAVPDLSAFPRPVSITGS